MSVLIVSEVNDPSCVSVIEWLIYYNINFYRINVEELLLFYRHISDNSNDLYLMGNQRIPVNELTAIWYWRGGISISNTSLEVVDGSEIQKLVEGHLKKESIKIQSDIYKYLEASCDKKLGCYEDLDVNKLDVLQKARSCGLNIPETIITNSRQVLLDFMDNNSQYIVKPAGNGIILSNNDYRYMQYTTTINKEDIFNDLNDHGNYIFPSIVQKRISKKNDIRVFVLENKIYSMAIFVNDSSKSVDVRNKKINSGYRYIPFQFPSLMEEKILSLMSKLNLKSASFDFLYSNDALFYFLEVNPVGQFRMVSVPCNYYIEKELALFLK